MRQDRKTVDQNPDGRFAAIRGRIEASRGLLARAGSVVATWRTYRGRRLGPYYRLSYREDGRQRSIYLGRSPGLVERVRGLLQDWQRPVRQANEFRRTRAVLMKDLRRQKVAWHRELRAAGLYSRGYVVRGWRHWRVTHSLGHFSPCHLVTLSPRHPVTPSPRHPVTLSSPQRKKSKAAAQLRGSRAAAVSQTRPFCWWSEGRHVARVARSSSRSRSGHKPSAPRSTSGPGSTPSPAPVCRPPPARSGSPCRGPSCTRSGRS